MQLATRKTSEPQKRGSWLLGDDLVGHKWGKMEVIAPAERPEGNYITFRGTWWLCRCECGKEKVLPRQYITNEQVKSCGCGRRKPAKKPEPERKPEKTPEREKVTKTGMVKLTKNDMFNLSTIIHERKCKRCKKVFVRTSKDWKYRKTINGKQHDYCSWDCYRGNNTGKKLTLTERARLQSEAAGR